MSAVHFVIAAGVLMLAVAGLLLTQRIASPFVRLMLRLTLVILLAALLMMAVLVFEVGPHLRSL